MKMNGPDNGLRPEELLEELREATALAQSLAEHVDSIHAAETRYRVTVHECEYLILVRRAEY